MMDRANGFEWSGGHPALDLVNTLDERPFPAPVENLGSYEALVRFTAMAGLIDTAMTERLLAMDARACTRIAGRARKLREHLHDVLWASHQGMPVQDSNLRALSQAIRAAHAARVLIPAEASGLADLAWAPAIAVEMPLHACALAIERLLIDVDRTRIRKCGARDCDVYFLDTSKGRRRHWCNMKGCGNREKQRRWRSTPA